VLVIDISWLVCLRLILLSDSELLSVVLFKLLATFFTSFFDHFCLTSIACSIRLFIRGDMSHLKSSLSLTETETLKTDSTASTSERPSLSFLLQSTNLSHLIKKSKANYFKPLLLSEKASAEDVMIAFASSSAHAALLVDSSQSGAARVKGAVSLFECLPAINNESLLSSPALQLLSGPDFFWVKPEPFTSDQAISDLLPFMSADSGQTNNEAHAILVVDRDGLLAHFREQKYEESVYVLDQLDVIRFLLSQRESLSEIGDQTLQELGLLSLSCSVSCSTSSSKADHACPLVEDLISATSDQTAKQAFLCLAEHHLAALPVVDPNTRKIVCRSLTFVASH